MLGHQKSDASHVSQYPRLAGEVQRATTRRKCLMLQKRTSFVSKTRDHFESGRVGNAILGLAKIRKMTACKWFMRLGWPEAAAKMMLNFHLSQIP